MKLGKLAARHDPRTLRLGKYVEHLTVPTEADWLSAISEWGMLGNDTLGDCTAASLGHARQVFSAAVGPEYTPPDADIIALYSASCGYVPGDPSTDNGGVELNVLNYIRHNGFFEDELVAYVDPDPMDVNHIKLAISLFGGVYIGLQLNNSALEQFTRGQPWDVIPNDPSGIAGGHAVFCPAFDSSGLTAITWGKPQRMTWPFWQKYCDEAHALLSRDWLSYASVDFNFGDLHVDLDQVVG